MRKEKEKRGFFYHVTNVLLLCVIVYSGYQVGSILLDYYSNRQVLEEAQNLFDESSHVETVNYDEPRVQFDELLKINEDIVGWIEIGDTNIHYPVLQAEDNKYYLNRNYLREETRAGSIFLDYRNDITEFSRNNIIYGHRMKDGSMFAHLKKYLDESFFHNHSTILYDTLYEGFELEVFSVYTTTTEFYYIQTDISSDEEYMNFISDIRERSHFDSDVPITSEDEIITLSTCDYGIDSEEGRLVVHAKVKKK